MLVLMSWLLAVVLKPFVAFVFFCAVYVLARFVLWLLPEGPLKRRLSAPIGGSKTRRRD